MDMVNENKITNLMNSVTNSLVYSQDGTNITYYSMGKGPSIIVIHGMFSTSEDLRMLAQELSDSFTVHVVERRGRGRSGPQGNEYSISKECEDLQAVQEATGATLLFAHSYGGLVALESVRMNTSFTKMALYDPGVSINNSIPRDWLPEYEKALNRNDIVGALVSIARGNNKALKRLPKWLVTFLFNMGVRGKQKNKMEILLPTILKEHRAGECLDSTCSNYQFINTDVLLIAGEKSPEWVHQVIPVLDKTLSHSKKLILPNLNHLAPNNKHAPVVAQHVKQYFLS
jgi:pimeloyl-ACP methyl ester carboxylesterase